MTHITLSGALTMISTNGDGPQLLTEAAEFLNALKELGVIVAVEINLRPVEQPTYNTPVRIVEHVADSGAFLATVSAPPFSNGEPPAAPLARAAVQPAETSWRKMTPDERRGAALHFLNGLYVRLDHAPTQDEYHAHKPAWMPTATPLVALFGMPWADLVRKACPF